MPVSRATWVNQAVAKFSVRAVESIDQLQAKVHAARIEGSPPSDEVLSVWTSVGEILASCHRQVVLGQRAYERTLREEPSGPDRPHPPEVLAVWRDVLDAATAIVDVAEARLRQVEEYNEGIAAYAARTAVPPPAERVVSVDDVRATINTRVGRSVV